MTTPKMRVRRIKNRLFELIRQKELKENRRITQKEIAEFAGITEHTVMHWVRNQTTRYDTIVLERVCDFFDCELSDLLYFEVTWVDIPEDPDQMED